MKIETLKQDNCMLEMTIEVEDERVQPALKAAARKIAKRYAVPGFRPGKAPYDVIVRQFGESALYETAIEDLGQKVYEEALDQEKIDAYGTGSLDDVKFKPMVLKFVIPLRPEVELGDYRALRVDYTAPEVKDEQVQDALEHLREHQSVMEPVERPAELLDVAVVDIKGHLNEGLNPSDFLLGDENVSLLLDDKTDWPAPGVTPFIVGMSAGEAKKFDLAFPDDYANDSLKGQVAHYEVKVKEVKKRTLPEWNDELAKAIGDYQSLEDLRAKVREDLVQQAQRTVEQDYREKLMAQLLPQTSIKYPPVLLDEEVKDLVEDLDRRLREQKLTLEDYLKIEGKTQEQLREEFKPRAEERLKRALILGKIIELEKIDLGDGAVDEHIEKLASPFGDSAGRIRELFSTAQARQSLSIELLTTKAFERLMAIAKGEEVPAPVIEGETVATEAAPASEEAQA